jgi:hypothetical protein
VRGIIAQAMAVCFGILDLTREMHLTRGMRTELGWIDSSNVVRLPQVAVAPIQIRGRVWSRATQFQL